MTEKTPPPLVIAKLNALVAWGFVLLPVFLAPIAFLPLLRGEMTPAEFITSSPLSAMGAICVLFCAWWSLLLLHRLIFCSSAAILLDSHKLYTPLWSIIRAEVKDINYNPDVKGFMSAKGPSIEVQLKLGGVKYVGAGLLDGDGEAIATELRKHLF